MDEPFIGCERPAQRLNKPRLKILWTLPYLPWPTLGGSRCAPFASMTTFWAS